MLGIDALKREMRQHFAALRDGMYDKFACLERKLALMATRDELDTAIGGLGTQIQQLGANLTTLGTDLQAAIDRLTAKVVSGDDFEAELDSVTGIATSLTSVGQQVQTIDAAAVAAGQDQIPQPGPVPSPEPGPGGRRGGNRGQ
jgi:hypothetical protein